jgi:Tfp pilus assembly protein PilF
MRNQYVIFASVLLSSFSLASTGPRQHCELRLVMANGSPLPQKAHAEIFDGDRKVSSVDLGANKPVGSLEIAPGDYRVQINGKDISYVYTGHLHVEETEPCAFHASLTGRATTGGLTDDEVDVEDLRITGKTRSTFQAGFTALEHGQLQPAKELFLKVIELAPNLSRAYNILGVISDQQGDLAAAQGYFEKSMELSPRSLSTKLNLAKLFMVQRQYRDALALLNEFGPTENTDVLVMKAQADLQLGRFDEAVKQARAVHLLSHSNWASVHVIAAQAYEGMNQPQLARVEYETYMRESPKGSLGAAASKRVQELGSAGVAERSASEPPPINSLLPRHER